MAAALLRLLPRRRAATLAPLIPASMSSYSKPPYPLHAVTTAGGGLPDVLRARLCASPAPSLHCLFVSEGCPRPAPRQPAHHQATCRLHKPRSPLPAAAAAGLPDVRHLHLSPASVSPLLRYYSSKPIWGCESLPRRQPLSDGKETPHLGQAGELLIGPLIEDLIEQHKILCEALKTCNKTRDLLRSEGWDDKRVAVLENGLEKVIKYLDICEKGMDDLLEALGSSNASKDTLQEFQMLHKEFKDIVKIKRQEFNNELASLVTLKKREKIDLVGGSSSFLLATAAFASGMCFVLAVMAIVRFLA